jgi:signal transduction histidine kinase
VNRHRLATALRQALATVREAATSNEESSLLSSVFDAIVRAEASIEGQASAPSSSGQRSTRVALQERIAELEKAVQARDEFLSTLGHELRNPLSPIFMQAQYLLSVVRQPQNRPIAADWLVARLEMFCSRLQKFLDMLNRIMEISRMSAGRVMLTLESFDLADAVRDTSASFERELALSRSTLTLNAPETLVGRWDRMRTEQIFSNLLSNAIRYGAGKPIEVKVLGDEQLVRLSVRDHGIGIPKEDQARIFRRFEQVAGQHHSGGFGIGLWIVHQSCMAMGGSVEVQSEGGQGTEFIVTLPRCVAGEP